MSKMKKKNVKLKSEGSFHIAEPKRGELRVAIVYLLSCYYLFKKATLLFSVNTSVFIRFAWLLSMNKKQCYPSRQKY